MTAMSTRLAEIGEEDRDHKAHQNGDDRITDAESNSANYAHAHVDKTHLQVPPWSPHLAHAPLQLQQLKQRNESDRIRKFSSSNDDGAEAYNSLNDSEVDTSRYRKSSPRFSDFKSVMTEISTPKNMSRSAAAFLPEYTTPHRLNSKSFSSKDDSTHLNRTSDWLPLTQGSLLRLLRQMSCL